MPRRGQSSSEGGEREGGGEDAYESPNTKGEDARQTEEEKSGGRSSRRDRQLRVCSSVPHTFQAAAYLSQERVLAVPWVYEEGGRGRAGTDSTNTIQEPWMETSHTHLPARWTRARRHHCR